MRHEFFPFDLGRNPQIERAVIRWPDNRPAQTLTRLEPDKLHAIQEPR